jgi:hypothetical protein
MQAAQQREASAPARAHAFLVHPDAIPPPLPKTTAHARRVERASRRCGRLRRVGVIAGAGLTRAVRAKVACAVQVPDAGQASDLVNLVAPPVGGRLAPAQRALDLHQPRPEQVWCKQHQPAVHEVGPLCSNVPHQRLRLRIKLQGGVWKRLDEVGQRRCWPLPLALARIRVHTRYQGTHVCNFFNYHSHEALAELRHARHRRKRDMMCVNRSNNTILF